jgi:hypothetical protein
MIEQGEAREYMSAGLELAESQQPSYLSTCLDRLFELQFTQKSLR